MGEKVLRNSFSCMMPLSAAVQVSGLLRKHALNTNEYTRPYGSSPFFVLFLTHAVLTPLEKGDFAASRSMNSLNMFLRSCGTLVIQ